MLILSDEELYRTIGTNIKYYRKLSNMTQVQLADASQISISYLSKIESTKCEKSLSISVLNQISNVLNVDIACFFQLPSNANLKGK